MSISLPEALRDFVEAQARAGGYESVSAYMRELVRRAKTDKDLEDKLLEALDSDSLGELAPGFFDDLREHVRRKASAKRPG